MRRQLLQSLGFVLVDVASLVLREAEQEHPRLVRKSHMTTLPAMHPLIETHRTELLALAHRRGVTGVRVFGSMSRGDGSDDSDVDLLVTLAPGTSALALGGLLLDAQELLGRRVDVVTEASLHPALRERVMAGAVPL
jgi:predicted nucleotidyltransferase